MIKIFGSKVSFYRAALIFSLALGFTGALPALSFAENAPAPSAATPQQALQTPAGKFIQDLGNNAISIIADKNLSAEQHTNKYRQILNDAFDIKTIGHFVIGRAWDQATPDQQQEYMKLFEAIVLKMYSDRLNFYNGENFRVKAVRPESEKDTIVNSEITHPDGSEPTSIDWRVRQTDGKLAIVDVVIEGVSQSVTQRQEYSSIIQRDGGKIDGLLVLMRQRLQQDQGSGNRTN